jgi:hypothetical protein
VLYNPITEHEKQYSPIISEDKSSVDELDQPYSIDLVEESIEEPE